MRREVTGMDARQALRPLAFGFWLSDPVRIHLRWWRTITFPPLRRVTF